MKWPFPSLALTAAVVFGGQSTVCAQVFTADFNTNNGGFVGAVYPGSTGSLTPSSWTHSATAGVGSNNGAWFVNNFEADTSTNAWIGLTLTSPVISITATSDHRISFDHRFSFEPSFDGGQLQVSLNGGGFVTVGNSAFTAGGYTGTIDSSFAGLSLIGGQQAWTGNSTGYATPNYVTSSATLAFSAGDSLQFRFLGVWDSNTVGTNPGWVIDNVAVTAIPEPPAIVFGAVAAVVAVGYFRRLRSARRERAGRA